jgi:hypothetical protein
MVKLSLYQGSCILHTWQLHLLANFTPRKEAYSIPVIRGLDLRTIPDTVMKRKIIFLKFEIE